MSSRATRARAWLKRLRACRSGAVDYLPTPVIPQVLQAKVAVFVELRKKNIALQAQSARLARRIGAAQAHPYQIKRHRIHVSASIGVSVYPRDGDSARTLMDQLRHWGGQG